MHRCHKIPKAHTEMSKKKFDPWCFTLQPSRLSHGHFEKCNVGRATASFLLSGVTTHDRIPDQI